MLSNTFKNLSIIITRPAHQAQGLCRAIIEMGGHPILFPTLTIAAAPNISVLNQIINTLDSIDDIIFLSPNAVEGAATKILVRWPTLPARLRFFAVGSGTATAMIAAKLPAPIYPSTEFNSEGLLALPELQSIHGQRILLVHGVGGRELLAQTLAARGAQVLHAIAYQRVPQQPDVAPVLAASQADQILVAIVTSRDSLNQFVKILSKSLQNRLQEMPLLVISERLAALAQELGFKRLIIAQNASDEAIIAALCKM